LREENAETRQQLGVLAVELRQEMRVSTSELRQENAETRRHLDVVATSLREENAETRQQLGVVAAELRQEMRVSTSDLRRHFDVTAEDFRHQVQQVAEGVDTVNERVDRLSRDMKNEFAESRAMVQISYSELTRRLSSLEDRVERLESSSGRPQ
jgi:predicted  nucleic acid-binding Zn-ribbon protein